MGFSFSRILDEVADWVSNKFDDITGVSKNDFYIKSDVNRMYQSISVDHRKAKRLENFQVVYLKDEIVSNTYKVYDDDICTIIASFKSYFDKFMSFYARKISPAFVKYFTITGKIIRDIGIEVAFESKLLAYTTLKTLKTCGRSVSKSFINRLNMLAGLPMAHTTAAHWYTAFDFKYTGHDIPTKIARLFVNHDGTQKHRYQFIKILKNGCVFSKDGLTFQECVDIVESIKDPNSNIKLSAMAKLSDFYTFMSDLSHYSLDMLSIEFADIIISSEKVKGAIIYNNHGNMKNIAKLAGVEIEIDIRENRKTRTRPYGFCYYYGTSVCCANFLLRMQAFKAGLRLIYSFTSLW